MRSHPALTARSCCSPWSPGCSYCYPGEQPFDGAAAYVPGPGAHPVAYFERNESGVPTKPMEGRFEGMPARWQTTDPAKIQVVACLDTPGSTFVETCSYQTIGEKSLVSPDYRITLYAAKTGRVLGTVHLASRKHDCPLAVRVVDGTFVSEVRLELSADQLVKGLSQVIG